MITLGLVDSVDDNGVYVTMPGSRGVLRGPYQTLQNVTAGDRVLMVTTDDGEDVIVGQAAAIRPRSTPATSTDNAVARFDGTTGALQNSGVTIDDSGNISAGKVTVNGSQSNLAVSVPNATNGDVVWQTDGSARWTFRKSADSEAGSNSGSNLALVRRSDAGSQLSLPIIVWRNTGKVTFGDVGTSAGIELGSSGPTITTGTGAPSHSAPNGSVYLRTDGTASTTLYVRAAGAWSALS